MSNNISYELISSTAFKEILSSTSSTDFKNKISTNNNNPKIKKNYDINKLYKSIKLRNNNNNNSKKNSIIQYRKLKIRNNDSRPSTTKSQYRNNYLKRQNSNEKHKSFQRRKSESVKNKNGFTFKSLKRKKRHHSMRINIDRKNSNQPIFVTNINDSIFKVLSIQKYGNNSISNDNKKFVKHGDTIIITIETHVNINIPKIILWPNLKIINNNNNGYGTQLQNIKLNVKHKHKNNYKQYFAIFTLETNKYKCGIIPFEVTVSKKIINDENTVLTKVDLHFESNDNNLHKIEKVSDHASFLFDKNPKYTTNLTTDNSYLIFQSILKRNKWNTIINNGIVTQSHKNKLKKYVNKDKINKYHLIRPHTTPNTIHLSRKYVLNHRHNNNTRQIHSSQSTRSFNFKLNSGKRNKILNIPMYSNYLNKKPNLNNLIQTTHYYAPNIIKNTPKLCDIEHKSIVISPKSSTNIIINSLTKNHNNNIESTSDNTNKCTKKPKKKINIQFSIPSISIKNSQTKL